MLLMRLSGHSGAGKSRLTAALPKHGITVPRCVLYTSRPARDGEVHGKDYYFLSKSAIAALPAWDFYVGPVREMLQAVDLNQLELDLKSNKLVLIEIFADLWPGLIRKLNERMKDVPNASVFMTAIDPQAVLSLPDEKSRAQFIQDEVEKILLHRAKDEAGKIKSRAKSAVSEVLTAIGPQGQELYSNVFHSAPEGPDSNDDWTREAEPIGKAKQVLDEFIAFFNSVQR